MLRILLPLLISLFVTSCGPRYVDYFPCHDDGKAKPQVALLPVMVPMETNESNELSRELTRKIRYEIMNDGELFLFSEQEIQRGLSEIGDVDWFCSNEMFAQHYCKADFIVLNELIHAPSTPHCLSDSCPCQTTFMVKMRVKVIDIRPRCPRVVLQEILTCDFAIPASADEVESGVPYWDWNSYKGSQLNRAHNKATTNLVRRIEEVIRSAY